MPRVSYVSLLDIWMLVCMIFVFVCILEFIVVTSHLRSGRKARGDQVTLSIAILTAVLAVILNITYNNNLTIQIETVSKAAIPATFLVFNLVYWPAVLVNYVDDK